MNWHFLSFLLDVTSWLVAGFVYGKFISKFDRLDNESGNIASIKIAMVALLGGLIATGERALPNYGFATYHFFIAMVYAFVYSIKYFGHFRKAFLNFMSNTLRLTRNVRIAGKGIAASKNPLDTKAPQA